MEITMHGAGQEVGRSCIEIQWYDRRLLLDCGIKIEPEQNEYPTQIPNLFNIDAVFLSHAHLDHSGALPLLKSQGLDCPIFCTETTKELTHLMLKDSWKIDRIEHRQSAYARACIRQVVNLMRLSTSGTYKSISYKLIPSGHIPGSVSILLEYRGERLLYTGDINGTPTHLLNKHKALPYADTLIVEATYGNRQHPARTTVEKEFARIVRDTVDNGGSVLIAAFAIGRSQEMMLLLDQMKLKCPIYLDGMSKQTTRIILSSKDKKDNALDKAAKRVDMVANFDKRKTIAKHQGIFIATSGMLDGGPVVEYMKHLGKDHNNTIILTGYQAEESNGRRLLEKGYVNIDGKDMDIHCRVHHLDFSAHAGENSLHDIIEKVKPKVVITNHGDPGSTKSLAAYARAKGIEAYAPKTGETIALCKQHSEK